MIDRFRLTRFPLLPACALATGLSALSMGRAHAADDGVSDDVSTVVVTDQRAEEAEGSAENGYRVSTTTLGPLGKTALKDTPYSVNVVSSERIENMQASSTSEALRYNPSARPQLGSNLASNYFMIRGF